MEAFINLQISKKPTKKGQKEQIKKYKDKLEFLLDQKKPGVRSLLNLCFEFFIQKSLFPKVPVIPGELLSKLSAYRFCYNRLIIDHAIKQASLQLECINQCNMVKKDKWQSMIDYRVRIYPNSIDLSSKGTRYQYMIPFQTIECILDIETHGWPSEIWYHDNLLRQINGFDEPIVLLGLKHRLKFVTPLPYLDIIIQVCYFCTRETYRNYYQNHETNTYIYRDGDLFVKE